MLQLHGAIYRPDSFVLMLRHYVNLKAIRYESTSLNRIAADKSQRVIVVLVVLASVSFWPLLDIESVARVSQHVLFTHDFLVKQV